MKMCRAGTEKKKRTERGEKTKAKKKHACVFGREREREREWDRRWEKEREDEGNVDTWSVMWEQVWERAKGEENEREKKREKVYVDDRHRQSHSTYSKAKHMG